ncbi:MAG TPA: hypothetical protein VK464_10435 [Symbiobacteriaceae bacterium]|jgi:hypothetical protein|nr:hypothetical protein [Symbiobacteriaceae bacterium]
MTGRRPRGGIAVQVLGAALLPLVLVLGLGLAEGARALSVRTGAQRALAAAVQSAAAAAPVRREVVFRQVLAANLGEMVHDAHLRVAPGELVGELRFPYRLTYLGTWLPPLAVQISHTEPAGNRNASR